MNSRQVKTTYLEMRTRPDYATPPLPANCLIMQARNPSVSFYKFLYGTVGKPWQWLKRMMMPENTLAAIIHDPLVHVYVLYVDGVPAGYAELDRRINGEIELAYFGLMSEYIGQGLGKLLLQWAAQKAWEYAPTRLWVHTCELDHPTALLNYLKAGFVIYCEKITEQPLPENAYSQSMYGQAAKNT